MSKNSPFSHWQQAIQPRDQAVELRDAKLPSGLPTSFQFSQNSLQDYTDCPRRFQLRYIEGLRWPAAESEPIEAHEQYIEQGLEFHALVQQHMMGIDEKLLAPAQSPLDRWWQAYLSYPVPDLPNERHPEVQFSLPVGNHRLMAKLDLLAVDPGSRMVIVDWKTARKRPRREWLQRRLQTKVYPYVLAEVGERLFQAPLAPEQIALVYWFTEEPGNPEVFEYSRAQHEDNHDYLLGLINEITSLSEGAWPQSADSFPCKFCVYRSLCDRGIYAGALEDGESTGLLDDDFDFDLDLDAIDEIAF